MKDLRLARKLQVFCGAFAILLVVMAGAAVWQMRAMDDVAVEINTEHVPQALAADLINTATSDYEVALGRIIMAPDTAARKQAEDGLAHQVEIINANYARITATDLDSQEAMYLKGFHDGWARYAAETRDIVAHARTGQRDQAEDLLNRMQPVMDKLGKDLDNFSAYQNVHIQHATDRAAGAFRFGWIGALVVLAVAAAALAFAYSLLDRLIARPLSAMTGALGQLAAGRRDVAVPVDAGADEVGDLARAMIALRDELAAADRAKEEQATMLVDSVGQSLRELAEGNLATRVTADLTGPFASLKADFNHAMVELAEVIATVSEGSADFDSAAGEIRAASADLARRTEEQAASIEETLAAMNEVTRMVESTAASAGDVDRTISKAHAEATQGGEVVARAVAAMADIERSSGQVTQIIDVIDGIAFQTNLLALNAGVEAARAGDAGKGFAVVASEVRALAARSADAARDIKSLIANSGEQVCQGVRLVSETGHVLDRIVGEVGTISSLANAIATSAAAQASQVQQVNAAISEMDRMTQQNAAMVEESTAAAGSLSEKSAELAALVSRFRTGAKVARAVPRKPVPAASPVRRVQPLQVRGNLALAPSDEDWSEF